jgi:hypothetical protein
MKDPGKAPSEHIQDVYDRIAKMKLSIDEVAAFAYVVSTRYHWHIGDIINAIDGGHDQPKVLKMRTKHMREWHWLYEALSKLYHDRVNEKVRKPILVGKGSILRTGAP